MIYSNAESPDLQYLYPKIKISKNGKLKSIITDQTNSQIKDIEKFIEDKTRYLAVSTIKLSHIKVTKLGELFPNYAINRMHIIKKIINLSFL
jgi:hypothetical protein